MPTYSSLKVNGYRDRPVSNTFIKQEGEACHLAIVYPGYGYTTDMPVLYYPAQLMQNLKADVVKVHYSYDENVEFGNTFDEEQYVWLYTDSYSIFEEAWKQGRYTEVTLIGKSLGSLAVAHIANSESRLALVNCIFITPTLTDHSFINDVLDAQPRSLFAIGTDDHYYHSDTLKDLEKATRSEALVFHGANHSLEIKNNIGQSLQIIERLMRVMEQFIRESRLG